MACRQLMHSPHTPQFEAEMLTDTKIASPEDAFAACRLMHDKGPHTVVSTALQLCNFRAHSGCLRLLAPTQHYYGP